MAYSLKYLNFLNFWRLRFYVKLLFLICVLLSILFLHKHFQNSLSSEDFQYSNGDQDIFIHHFLQKLNQHNGILQDQDSNFKLANMFKQADLNSDGHLDESEISAWISAKVKGHITRALRDNIFHFLAVDVMPKNGVITWEEYLDYFLKKIGVSLASPSQLNTFEGFTKEIKDAILVKKAAWAEAALEDASKLSITEFLAFRHPEASHNTITAKADREIQRLDLNGDESLTEEEYVGGHERFAAGEMVTPGESQERGFEFRQSIDKNGNGRAERSELIDFFSPSGASFSAKEARLVLKMFDTNSDSMLSAAEAMNNRELVLKSKLIDVGISLHEEF